METTTDTGDGATRTVTYTYSDGRLSEMTVTLHDGGSPETVRTVQYAYHSGSDGHGAEGDLKLVTTLDAQSQAVDRKYYRYYTGEYDAATNPGHPGAMKLTLSGASIERAIAGLQLGGVAGLDTATDEQLKPYADEYLEYHERHLHHADLRVVSRTAKAPDAASATASPAPPMPTPPARFPRPTTTGSTGAWKPCPTARP